MDNFNEDYPFYGPTLLGWCWTFLILAAWMI